MKKEAGCRRVYTIWPHFGIKHCRYAQMAMQQDDNNSDF